MNLTEIAGLVLALALVTGSAAALPGAAPAQADANETADTGGCKFVKIFATRGGELLQFVTATSMSWTGP